MLNPLTKFNNTTHDWNFFNSPLNTVKVVQVYKKNNPQQNTYGKLVLLGQK